MSLEEVEEDISAYLQNMTLAPVTVISWIEFTLEAIEQGQSGGRIQGLDKPIHPMSRPYHSTLLSFLMSFLIREHSVILD